MAWLIWIGAVVSLAGLAMIAWCIVVVVRAKRAGMEEDRLRAELARLPALNMAALLLSCLGLMMVVVGILLG